MNVILGERSSGKTFTLKRILDAYEPEDRLYIEQFEITNKAKKDIFDKNVAEEDSVFFDNYFNALQDAINHYTQFDQGACEDAVRRIAQLWFNLLLHRPTAIPSGLSIMLMNLHMKRATLSKRLT